MIGGEGAHELTKDDAIAYIKAVKDLFHDKREKYDEFLDVMLNFSAQRVDTADVIATVKELFKGQPMLILGFNTFLPKGYEITLQAEDEQLPLTKQEVISFLNKVKARFMANDGVYKSFCNILIMYSSNPISDIYQEVATLFGHHKDLLVEFTHLASARGRGIARRVMRPTNSDKKNPVVTSHPDHDHGTEHLDVVPERPLTKESREQILGDDKSNEHRDARDRTHYEILNRDFKTDNQKDQFLNNKQELHIRGNGLDEISIAESLWNEGKYPQLNTSLDNDVERERDEGFKDRDHEKERLKKAAASRKWAKPISELNLSNCEQCSPSYRLLPKDYPIRIASHKTELGNQVLNDHWVCVASGSGDYSSSHMRKNQYEESLSLCEDDRYELDMLLESVNSTIKHVEELLVKINSNELETNTVISIEDQFTASNVRCIERLYGDHGLEVMNVLKKSAALTLPVILTRLKQKRDEWERCLSEYNILWADIYAKYYHKSLDHRSL